MLSKVNSVISDWLVEQFQSCSSRSRKRSITLKPAVRTRSGDFFRYTDAGKILLLVRLPGRVMFGRLQSIRRWAGNFLLLFQSRPARRRGYGPAGRTCSVQVGRVEEIKPHYREYCQSSFPIQSMQVLWPLPQQQHSVSFHVGLTCSIYSEVWCWPCPRKQ